ERSELFKELLRSELVCRRDQGESPSHEEYQARFPGDVSLVDAVFVEWPSLSASGVTAQTQSFEAPAEQAPPGSGPERVARPAETKKVGQSAATPRSLSIRCPHCDSPFKIRADAPETEFTCAECGNHFSIVGENLETQQAPTVAKIGPRGRFELVERLGFGGF